MMGEPQWAVCGVHKGLLEHSRVHVGIVWGCVVLQQQIWILMTETLWATEPRVFTICSFIEKAWQTQFWRNRTVCLGCTRGGGTEEG